MKTGQTEEAERWYKEALKAKADHIPAHLTMAKLLHKKVSNLSLTSHISLKGRDVHLPAHLTMAKPFSQPDSHCVNYYFKVYYPCLHVEFPNILHIYKIGKKTISLYYFLMMCIFIDWHFQVIYDPDYHNKIMTQKNYMYYPW